MKIAFLHYHLKPGGVTTVILQQIRAMRKDCEVLVVSGEPPDKDFDGNVLVVPEIGYDLRPHPPLPPEKTAEKILSAIAEFWPSGSDILHVHNPLLAKNRNFLKILTALQDRNVRLLLQVHDFAEDGRPQVFYGNDDYPQDCHYCVINSRDYDILRKSGLTQNGLHLLFNMVTPFPRLPGPKFIENRVLYPVRAIRRKNIGEAILISLFFLKKEQLAVTLPPNSPRDWKYYIAWKKFVALHGLNVLFEASLNQEFGKLIASAQAMITTSISEGFGFSFLEPWTAEKMLIGRLIPETCGDFIEKGMRLDHLYKKILVPIDGLDIEKFFSKWKFLIKKNAEYFQIRISDSSISEAYARVTTDQTIDFKLMDETFQKQVLTKILSNPAYKDRIKEINPFLSDILYIKDCPARIQHNKMIVEKKFSRSNYRKRLLDTYQKVIQHRVRQKIHKQILAKEFLSPDDFSLLKWEDPHD